REARDGSRAGHWGAAQDAEGAAGGERGLTAPGQAPRGWARADASRSGGAPATADAAGNGRNKGRPEPARLIGGPDAAVGGDGPAARWGAYELAIHRWERAIGRPAPAPTEPGRTGQRLSPAFVEWLMGLPEGWVTDVPGLSRNAQLKALGNGVVPQQAAMALRMLLERADAAPLVAARGAA